MNFRSFSKNLQNNPRKALSPSLFFLAGTLCILPGCGHKQRSVLYAVPGTPTTKISTLSLPAVRMIDATMTPNGNLISWQPPPTESNTKINGYLIYRITRKHCIPRKPLNALPLVTPSYLDNARGWKNARFYVIRGIFAKNEVSAQGPLSRMFNVSP